MIVNTDDFCLTKLLFIWPSLRAFKDSRTYQLEKVIPKNQRVPWNFSFLPQFQFRQSVEKYMFGGAAQVILDEARITCFRLITIDNRLAEATNISKDVNREFSFGNFPFGNLISVSND